MPTDEWERGYSAGYRAAHRTDVRDITSDRGEKVSKKPRRTSDYSRFNKGFSFRKRKRNERSSDYLAARNKAVSRAWKREKKR